MRKSTMILLSAAVVCAGMLSGCKHLYDNGYGPIVKNGLKDPGSVAPQARAFASGQVSLDQALDSPEARADRGAAIVGAIKDLPPARAR